MSVEYIRIQEMQNRSRPWREWGPYVSDRQWGTVREDYSGYGTAWDFVSFDMSRSYAYRWGEDGIGGICDEKQILCFAPAFWNHRDPFLKERLFGLTGHEGNHGEDVKEIYYYLDNIPSHAYMKMLYKYPISKFPYEELYRENRERGKDKPEFEIIDTGVFNDGNYFDIFIEYAKKDPEDILIRITAFNRSKHKAPLDIVPQVWFRNTWAWGIESHVPSIFLVEDGVLKCSHENYGDFYFSYQSGGTPLFCDNERNGTKLYGLPGKGRYFKDGINDYVVSGYEGSVNPELQGTKAGVQFSEIVLPGESITITCRLGRTPGILDEAEFASTFSARIDEADEFYREKQKDINPSESDQGNTTTSKDTLDIQRQAFAGLLWTKQFYYFDVRRWLEGDPSHPPPPPERKRGRNNQWKHLFNEDVISMPDKWEYPWYAAWDLAFHCVPFALIDSDFAKRQLVLMTREWYMHPNGQIPAYEWAFGDVNPPVHAWASWRVFQIDRKHSGGTGDIRFLERILHKLMINFTWWVNRKDEGGRNIFQGGFLGLDNIGVFDRSAPLPTGGYINQADGTSWMAMYCLNLMRISLELAKHNSIYEDIASKFFEHFLFIAQAMTNMAEEGIGLWDEKDGFFYDVLQLPEGKSEVLRLRSMVGLIPLFAVEALEPELLERLPNFHRRLKWVFENRPELANLVSHWEVPGKGQRRLLSLLRGHRMKKILSRMLDETEFLSPHGIRAMSKVYESDPFVFDYGDTKVSVNYQPAESNTLMFGGNSNWRGPVWFPVNYLIIESLQKFHHYYGDEFKVECPTGSGKFLSILEVANELSSRLGNLFLRNEEGKRPVFGNNPTFQEDPHFKDYILFYEYFHGDTGRGAGASHQTGWTALVSKLLKPRQNEN
ncbi:MAG TPA: glucosidase [Oligoflexia bacterium]|nr:glucosidase [Oligoflexia bacterium]HMP49346.1 glucosidase [Oligoflexia bacterium]